MSRLDDLVVRHPLATWRSVAWPVMSLLAVLLVWAQFARLDEVAIATGEVVPQGKMKVVQHLEGGIIEHIQCRGGISRSCRRSVGSTRPRHFGRQPQGASGAP
jgi:adhesin transport system membrane fusion protein